MQPAANASHFTCTLNGCEDFAFCNFSGREVVSEPYEFTLELVYRNAAWT